MRELPLNDRVLDKLAHITQLAQEIRDLLAEESPDDLAPIASALAPIEDGVHRIAKQLTEAPLGRRVN